MSFFNRLLEKISTKYVPDFIKPHLNTPLAKKQFDDVKNKNMAEGRPAFCGTNTTGLFHEQVYEQPINGLQMGQCGKVKDSARFYCCPQCVY